MFGYTESTIINILGTIFPLDILIGMFIRQYDIWVKFGAKVWARDTNMGDISTEIVLKKQRLDDQISAVGVDKGLKSALKHSRV